MINTDDCWLWARNLNTREYGTMLVKIDGKWRTQMAHRVIYQALVGDIPTDYQVDHLCRIRRCINPDHLEAVTFGENLRREFLALRPLGKQSMDYCKNGHKFTKNNTYLHKNGSNICRNCRRQQTAKWRAKLKAKL